MTSQEIMDVHGHQPMIPLPPSKITPSPKKETPWQLCHSVRQHHTGQKEHQGWPLPQDSMVFFNRKWGDSATRNQELAVNSHIKLTSGVVSLLIRRIRWNVSGIGFQSAGFAVNLVSSFWPQWGANINPLKPQAS